MRVRCVATLGALFLAAVFPAARPAIGDGVAPLARAEFEKLRKELVPTSKAAWETIPWRSDLLAAREEAVKSGKPLFLWAMNGHPLGCT